MLFLRIPTDVKRQGMNKKIVALVLFFFLAFSSFAPASFGQSAPSNPIQHIIFIIQENHSFDNYFGTYPGANNLSNAPPCCPTSLSGAAEPAQEIQPFHLNVSQPVFIVGDELPPGQMYPNASDDLTATGNDVAPFQIPT